MTSARLNGFELVETGPGSGERVVPLNDPLPDRNELVLEVDLSLVEESRIAEEWGSIALVIAPKATLAG